MFINTASTADDDAAASPVANNATDDDAAASPISSSTSVRSWRNGIAFVSQHIGIGHVAPSAQEPAFASALVCSQFKELALNFAATVLVFSSLVFKNTKQACKRDVCRRPKIDNDGEGSLIDSEA